jgi:hypothetical protein
MNYEHQTEQERFVDQLEASNHMSNKAREDIWLLAGSLALLAGIVGPLLTLPTMVALQGKIGYAAVAIPVAFEVVCGWASIVGFRRAGY